jgi:hypothetical protein
LKDEKEKLKCSQLAEEALKGNEKLSNTDEQSHTRSTIHEIKERRDSEEGARFAMTPWC